MKAIDDNKYVYRRYYLMLKGIMADYYITLRNIPINSWRDVTTTQDMFKATFFETEEDANKMIKTICKIYPDDPSAVKTFCADFSVIINEVSNENR